jgi:hypothetical protein
LDVRLAAGPVAVAALLATPVAAHAATLSVSPVKPCYRTNEVVRMAGAGFTPGGTVRITADGRLIADTPADGSGSFGGRLIVRTLTQRVKTYTATDQSNTANTASVPLTISPFFVRVSPRNGPPGRRLRIRASGFNTGRQLFAHVIRGRRRSNIRLGRLRGPCGRLTARRRLFPGGASPGVYTIQFDARRRYSPDTRVRIRFRVTVYRIFGSRASQAWISG